MARKTLKAAKAEGTETVAGAEDLEAVMAVGAVAEEEDGKIGS